MNRAMVIAHQDDEVLWGIPEPGSVVFCCSTPHDDVDREWQFFQSCNALEVKGVVSKQRAGKYVHSDVKLQLHEFLSGIHAFDEVLTHNTLGEYGHPQHKQVNQWVNYNYGGSVRQFGYNLPEAMVRTLTDAQFARKIKALQCYDGIVPGTNGERTWERMLRSFFGGKLENLRYERFVGRVSAI